MMSESRGAGGHPRSRCARVKGQFSGAFLSPAVERALGRIGAAKDPSAERVEGLVARSRNDYLPSSSSNASGNPSSKDAGVSTIWAGVLVAGIRYP